MASVTLTDLQDRAKDYADMTGSSFPVSARLTEYINDALAVLHEVLIDNGFDGVMTSQTVTLVAGTESYALASDFYRLKVAWFVDGSTRYKMRRWDYESAGGRKLGPASSGTVHLWYAPMATRLSAGGDTVNAVMPHGWEDYVALDAAVKLLIREESDPSALMQLRNETLGRIISRATVRDENEPESILDMSGRLSGGSNRLPLGRSLLYRLEGANIRFLEDFDS